MHELVDGVLAVARRSGLRVSEPVVLADSNNLVLWLAPEPVVAKTGTGHHQRLQHELSVAVHLAGRRAPVVKPSTRVPQRTHPIGTGLVTFWEHRPDDGTEPAASDIAEALAEVHRALAEYIGPLPLYRDELVMVGRLLERPDSVPSLPEADRQLLLGTLLRLRDRVGERPYMPIHGSPHRGNIVSVEGSPLFLDFETVSVGPLEWDLAHLDSGVADAYRGHFDPFALAVCRGLVSVKTAAWCWANVEHSQEMRWHAEYHLERVRELDV